MVAVTLAFATYPAGPYRGFHRLLQALMRLWQVVSLPPTCRYQAVKRGNRGSVIGVGLEVGFDQDKGQSTELQVRLPLPAHGPDSAAYCLQAPSSEMGCRGRRAAM